MVAGADAQAVRSYIYGKGTLLIACYFSFFVVLISMVIEAIALSASCDSLSPVISTVICPSLVLLG